MRNPVGVGGTEQSARFTRGNTLYTTGQANLVFEGMSQSLSVVYLHLVFSTKLRTPFLYDRSLRMTLHAWLGAASERLGCPSVIVGGAEDHVHVLARMSRTITQADWVKELKRVSSIWIKEHDQLLAEFAWQSGYAVFSVAFSDLATVSTYIANQEAHHNGQGFQDELRSLLRSHNEPWDERYVWA